MTYAELNEFARRHHRATLFLRAATFDYADARCLILNGLLGGLASGAQAMEKLLKAYLLFQDPSKNVKRILHKLPDLLAEVARIYPNLDFSPFRETASKFEKHYASRYPDSPNASTSMTGQDIHELDEFVIFLNENLPCPRAVRYRAGMYALITISLEFAGTVTPWEFWIKSENRSLTLLIAKINAEAKEVVQELYPDQDLKGIFA